MKANDRAIRVCMVSYYFTPEYSGSAIQAASLSGKLKTLGVRPFVICANLSNSPAVDDVDGLPTYRLAVVSRGHMAVIVFWLKLSHFLWENRHSYDLIHAHGTMQHGIASIMGRILGKRTILKVAMANHDIAFSRQGRIWGRINEFLVSRFDRYIAISRDIQREFDGLAWSKNKVRAIPNGVDTDRYYPARSEAEKSALRTELGLPSALIVTYVGGINSRKNIRFLIECWLESVRAGVDGYLLIVGPVEITQDSKARAYFEALQSYTRAASISDRVIFTGYQPEVEKYLRASDVFVLPSKQEGMPNVLLEAMASGLAAIASRESAAADIIDNDRTGFLIDIGKPDELVGCLAQLALDENRRNVIGKAARRHIERYFSLSAIARAYEALYNELLANPKL